MNRPTDAPEQAVASSSNKPLPAIKETLINDFSQLNLQETHSVDQATREALTDPLVFETVPAVSPLRIAVNKQAFSLSFVLGKQPPNPDSLSLEDLLVSSLKTFLIFRIKVNTTS